MCWNMHRQYPKKWFTAYANLEEAGFLPPLSSVGFCSRHMAFFLPVPLSAETNTNITQKEYFLFFDAFKFFRTSRSSFSWGLALMRAQTKSDTCTDIERERKRERETLKDRFVTWIAHWFHPGFVHPLARFFCQRFLCFVAVFKTLYAYMFTSFYFILFDFIRFCICISSFFCLCLGFLAWHRKCKIQTVRQLYAAGASGRLDHPATEPYESYNIINILYFRRNG